MKLIGVFIYSGLGITVALPRKEAFWWTEFEKELVIPQFGSSNLCEEGTKAARASTEIHLA